MGTATVEQLTSTQAIEERDALLDALALTLEEAREKASAYLLTPEEASVWRRIDELTWLLGE